MLDGKLYLVRLEPMTWSKANDFCSLQKMTLTSQISESTRQEMRFFGLGAFWVLTKQDSKCMMNNHANQLGLVAVRSCDMYFDVVCEKEA